MSLVSVHFQTKLCELNISIGFLLKPNDYAAYIMIEIVWTVSIASFCVLSITWNCWYYILTSIIAGIVCVKGLKNIERKNNTSVLWKYWMISTSNPSCPPRVFHLSIDDNISNKTLTLSFQIPDLFLNPVSLRNRFEPTQGFYTYRIIRNRYYQWTIRYISVCIGLSLSLLLLPVLFSRLLPPWPHNACSATSSILILPTEE